MTALNPDPVSKEKDLLREQALARRDALPATERQASAEFVASRAFPIDVPRGAVVSGFMPMKSEINPLPLLKRLAAGGATLALPVVAGRGKPLIMRAWEFGAPLDQGVWGIRQPKAESPEVDPDILIVPLAAFDRRGHRIGYGAGYFDMTINRLRRLKSITAIGIAFAVQEIPRVPATERDEPLDLVLTEREIIDCRK
jgi:5-formyltetrahydrofolate cyclo-ligase